MPKLSQVVVIGGGIAGLSAAYSLVKAGFKPIILEERSRPGGLIAATEIAGMTGDIGAESYGASSEDITALCQELGLGVTRPQGNSWVWSHDNGGHATPIPDGILGIPASLDDPAVVQALTPAQIQQAQADFGLGTQIWSDNLAELVESRLGPAVLDKLVRVITTGIYASSPQDLDVNTLSPKLRTAFLETGSLLDAVAKLRSSQRGGSAVLQPIGGMFCLVQALQKAILAGGGQILTHRRALKLHSRIGSALPGGALHCNPEPDHYPGPKPWRVCFQKTQSNPQTGGPPLAVGSISIMEADAIILATPGPVAVSLLKQVFGDCLPRWDLPQGSPIANITLALHHRDLDSGPRGSGILVAPPPSAEDPNGNTSTANSTDALGQLVQAKALTHYSYKWPQTSAAFTKHHHLVRVSYGRPGQDLSSINPELACRDASRLLGVEITPTHLLAAKTVFWGAALPPHSPTHREGLSRLQEFLANAKDLEVVGAWRAGSGLAATIPSALAAGERLAKELLKSSMSTSFPPKGRPL